MTIMYLAKGVGTDIVGSNSIETNVGTRAHGFPGDQWTKPIEKMDTLRYSLKIYKC
jgi:hypothetical protein